MRTKFQDPITRSEDTRVPLILEDKYHNVDWIVSRIQPKSLCSTGDSTNAGNLAGMDFAGVIRMELFARSPDIVRLVVYIVIVR